MVTEPDGTAALREVVASREPQLRDVLAAMEAEREAALRARERARETLRSLERTIQRLDSRIVPLREMLNELGPRESVGSISVLLPGSGSGAPLTASLAGLPRVQAIEIILSEAGGAELHRNQIWQRLRERGFPAETLGDTSAALAYLKRLDRAKNTARGYWRAPAA